MGTHARKIASEVIDPAAIFGPANTPRSTERDRIVEQYAQAYVETRQWNAAYRRLHDCSRMSAATVYNNACELARYPGVRDRVRELLDEAAQRTICTVAQVLAAQLEIATADPRAVVHTTKHACRNCHGIDGEYHWRDPQEFDKACAAELDASAEQRRMPHMPSDDGGYGYTMHRAPNPECESCGGSGQTVTHIADMRELSDSAAKLIKGVKQDRFGAVTVELRDQDAAWREVARILGAYKDSLTVTPRPPAPVEIPADTPREKVGEAYLALVTG